MRKDFISVSSGVAGGQILALLAMPVISRLYAPADFGVLGTATSLAGVIAAAAALQYPQALVLPRRDSTAANLLAVSLFISVTVAALTGLVLVLVRLTGLSPILHYPALVWSVAALVLFAGVNQALQAWCVRRKAFRRTTLSPIVRSVALVTTQIGAGLSSAGASGLIAGTLLGEGAANLNLARQVVQDDRRLFQRSVTASRMRWLAWHYRDISGPATIRAFISTASISLPVLYFTYTASAATIGLYSLAMRAFQMPMTLISVSLRQVLLQKMAEHQLQRISLAPLIKRTVRIIATATIPPGCVLFILAPALFALIFGQQWREAGEYARWLIPWAISSLCNTPCLVSAQVLRMQRLLLKFEVFIFFSRTVVFVIAYKFFDPVIAIAAWSIASTLMNISLISIILGKAEMRATA